MFFIIYKTTNMITNEYYIGKHYTENLNDGYLEVVIYTIFSSMLNTIPNFANTS